MVDRTKPRQIALRSTCPWRVYDEINKRSCFHLDAWCVQNQQDTLYFVFQSRAGGQQLLSETVARVDGNALTQCEGNAEAFLRMCTQRHIDSPWARRNAPHLERVHRDLIQPWLRMPREGFKGYQSIALHYVYSDPRVCDPCEGLPNYHGNPPVYSEFNPYLHVGAEHPDRDQLYYKDTAPWSAEDRSRLRTLGKLLK